MKYRSRTDIVGLILEAANGGGATKTKIMYNALISYNLMKEYLTLLAENNLLEYEEGNMTYRTTEKGLQLLRIYNNMNEIAPLSGTRSVVHKNELGFYLMHKKWITENCTLRNERFQHRNEIRWTVWWCST